MFSEKSCGVQNGNGDDPGKTLHRCACLLDPSVTCDALYTSSVSGCISVLVMGCKAISDLAAGNHRKVAACAIRIGYTDSYLPNGDLNKVPTCSHLCCQQQI